MTTANPTTDFAAQRRRIEAERDALAARRQPLALAAEQGDADAVALLTEIEQGIAAAGTRLERLALAEAEAKRQAEEAQRQAEAARRQEVRQRITAHREEMQTMAAALTGTIDELAGLISRWDRAATTLDQLHGELGVTNSGGLTLGQRARWSLADYVGWMLRQQHFGELLQPGMGTRPAFRVTVPE